MSQHPEPLPQAKAGVIGDHCEKQQESYLLRAPAQHGHTHAHVSSARDNLGLTQSAS